MAEGIDRNLALEDGVNRFHGSVQISIERLGVRVAKVKVSGALNLEDMEVDMGNVETRDDEPDPPWFVHLLDCAADPFPSQHEVCCSVVVKVYPVFDLHPGHHKRVADCQRFNREKGHTDVVLVDETTWQFTVDDSCKYRCHHAPLVGRFSDSTVAYKLMGRKFLVSVILFDTAALVAAVLFATVRVFGVWAPWLVVEENGSLMPSVVLVAIGAAISMYVSFLSWGRTAPRPLYGRALMIVTTTMAITALGLIVSRSYWSREWLLTVASTWLLLALSHRFVRRRKPWREDMVVITNEKQLADDLRMSPTANVVLVADPLGDPSDIPLVDAQTLVLDLRAVLSDDMAQWVSSASVSGQRVVPLVSVYEEHTGRLPLVHIVGGWEVSRPVERSGYASAKRLLDIVVVAVTIPLWIAVWVVIWMVVRVDSGGPALYRQERVGRSGELFTLVKFRTMVHSAEANGPQFAQPNDPRLTRPGAFLRRTRLDEIPQLWSVLKGDLSLVGPRPERPVFVDRFSETIPFYESRHLIRPGVTGWAQVNYGYADGDADAVEKLTYDLYYVKHSSIWLDLHILGRSVWTVLSGFGAR